MPRKHDLCFYEWQQIICKHKNEFCIERWLGVIRFWQAQEKTDGLNNAYLREGTERKDLVWSWAQINGDIVSSEGDRLNLCDSIGSGSEIYCGRADERGEMVCCEGTCFYVLYCIQIYIYNR